MMKAKNNSLARVWIRDIGEYLNVKTSVFGAF